MLNPYVFHFMTSLQSGTMALDEQKCVELSDVFEAVPYPLLSLNAHHFNDSIRFMILIGRFYTDVQGHLRWLITSNYQSTLSLFMALVVKAAPLISAQYLFWRLHFTLAVCVFTMASFQAVSEIAANDFDHVMLDANQLILFLSSGVNAINTITPPVIS